MLTTATILYLAGACFFGSLVRQEASGCSLCIAMAFWPLVLILMLANHFTRHV